ncbi:hypothetical protein HYPSUDRAFT_49516 [Hypholoma sublateritium FD-334 SS-4]|uniref:Peptidase C14 caspase domain-containing protein n=1 Tax=Hypholoma sublateritium (strain FD-334 SS-4) TaxID=945553 RepID=A0A0D2NBL4_HYPSF|nr:hypothetical protein HYPSUDRAFT_49516 [Hypholoma sublateritium FD-334 SS-4]
MPDDSQTRMFSMPIPHPSAIPLGQAHSYYPYGARSDSYAQNIPPHPVTPPHSLLSTYEGAVRPQKIPRYVTSPMPTASPLSCNNSTYFPPETAVSPAGWPLLLHGHYPSSTSPEIPPFLIGTHHVDEFALPEGNQYAEPEPMVSGGSFEHSSRPWDHPQEPSRHQYLPQSQQRDVRYLYEEYPRPLSPPRQPSAPPRSYPSSYDHSRRPQTQSRPHGSHATTLQSSQLQANHPPPPPIWPRSIVHSTSEPTSTSHSSSGARQNSVYVSGRAVPYNDVEYAGSAQSCPPVGVESLPSRAGHWQERRGVAASATLPPPLTSNTPVYTTGHSPVSFAHSVVGLGHNPIYKEPEELLEGSDSTRWILEKGIKKALLVGINYTGQAGDIEELHGCVHDVLAMGQFLIDQGYLRENIRTLTDDVNDRTRWPTKMNILANIDWLVRDSKESDTFFFHFSGHGTRVKDEDGDEREGYDDAILPVDHVKNGYILDDELNRRLVKPLSKGCRLTTLVDACHSGTSMDLPFQYSNNDHCNALVEIIDEKNVKTKGTEADVVSFSSCRDDEVAEDISSNELDVGAMTSIFINAYRDGLTYRQFFNKIGSLMKGDQHSQKPQLGTSHKINLDCKIVF